jgi:uncharacterized OB-fold protein
MRNEQRPRPAPIVAHDTEFFWEATRERRLVAQRCGVCGVLRHPPRPMCPQCNSLDIDIVELSGRGVVYSFSFVHYPQSPAFDYPVFAALVDLEEGVRLVTNLVEVDKDSVQFDMPVEVVWAPAHDGYHIPLFRPRDGRS